MSKRIFTKAKDATRWIEHVLDETNKAAIGILAEEIYKHSEKYTYEDSHDMYKSGAMYSKFNEGTIIERSPYVRRRYYEGGNPNKGHPTGQAHWFEKTISVYKDKYVGMYGDIVEEKKK